MKTEMQSRICPKCGAIYTGVPALSREDSRTLICPDCGILESLESLEICTEEREKILSIIHQAMGR
ncbi:MAG: transposase [Ruminococcus sp.]|nr:transposase [Ruminococcus sp.]